LGPREPKRSSPEVRAGMSVSGRRWSVVTDFDLEKLGFTLAATIRGEIFDEA
jgi:hypothetical protein